MYISHQCFESSSLIKQLRIRMGSVLDFLYPIYQLSKQIVHLSFYPSPQLQAVPRLHSVFTGLFLWVPNSSPTNRPIILYNVRQIKSLFYQNASILYQVFTQYVSLLVTASLLISVKLHSAHQHRLTYPMPCFIFVHIMILL